MSRPTPAAPRHLSAPTRAWWRAIVGRFELDEARLRVLLMACEALDDYGRARSAIGDQLTVADRFGQLRQHPLFAVMRDSRLAFLRAARDLDIPADLTPRPAPYWEPDR